jgi:hypothetical protein
LRCPHPHRFGSEVLLGIYVHGVLVDVNDILHHNVSDFHVDIGEGGDQVANQVAPMI